LLQLVDAGQISQAEADQVWENQIRLESREDVKTLLDDKEKMGRVGTEISEYRKYVTGLDEYGNENRNKVQTEYDALVDRGLPNDPRTELAALKAVFGNISALQAKAEAKKATKEARETSQEVGGEKSETSASDSDVIKNLTPRQKAHYERLMGTYYKNWDDVRKELEDYAK